MKKTILIVALALAPFAFANFAVAKPNNENTQYSQTVKNKKKVKKKTKKVAQQNNPFLRCEGIIDLNCSTPPKPTVVASNYEPSYASSVEESPGDFWRKEYARMEQQVPVKTPKPKENKNVVRRDCLFCDNRNPTYAEAKKWEGKNSRDKNDRKELLSLFNESTIPPIDPGKLPWCAAFANAILNKLGHEGTNSLMARSFLRYGSPTKEPQVGDIVVTKRGRGNVAGHVGFFEGYEVVDGVTYVKVFGGNTQKMVSTGWFPVNAVLGYRRVA